MAPYTRDNLNWESYDGRKTLIKDLEVRHLVNILNHVKESNDESGEPFVYESWVCQLLEAEGEIRIMAGWAMNIGIPRRNEDGTWEVINQTATEKAREDAISAVHKMAMQNQRLSKAELIANIHNNQQLTTPEMCK